MSREITSTVFHIEKIALPCTENVIFYLEG